MEEDLGQILVESRGVLILIRPHVHVKDEEFIGQQEELLSNFRYILGCTFMAAGQLKAIQLGRQLNGFAGAGG